MKNTKQALGGRQKIIITGSAPIDPEILGKLKIFFGVNIIEGYGMSENSAICTSTKYLDEKYTGHVGYPQSCVEYKLVDIPEMDYFTEGQNPKGEICSRGPTVMKKYLFMQEETLETVDKNGWLHTGDVGMITDHGGLKIIDRKKNIFKLSQGEYLAPEKIEGIICKNQFIEQIVVDGKGTLPYCVALVVPDFLHLKNTRSDLLGGATENKDIVTIAEVEKF